MFASGNWFFRAHQRGEERRQGLAPRSECSPATAFVGERFEISFNTYKPFACGIVIHPSIDASVQLREQGVRPEDVERIELRVHSLVLELTGTKEPSDGLQAKLSVYHGCAAGLIFGRAGEGEFADDIVSREDVAALRRKVVATVDDAVDEAAADVTAILHDGRRLHVRVEHALGSLERPLSDAGLAAKFSDQAEPILGTSRTAALIVACRRLGELADVREVCRLATVPA